jgi:hypothetical protein
MASKRNAAKILRTAAKLIDVHGFTKGQFGHEKCGFCTLGALNNVAGGSIPRSNDWILARAALYAFVSQTRGTSSVVFFNDDPKTTKRDVTKFLRGTARALEHGLVVK